MKIHARNDLLILFIAAFCHLAVLAQTNGSIVGTVVDQNGAAVPDASVQIKGEAGQQFSASSGADGLYSIPAVPSGSYMVTVSAHGFKTSVKKGISVVAGQPAGVETQLEVGDMGETVEVSGGAEILQSQTTTVSSTISGRQITEMPNISRDALNLATILPGVSTVGKPRSSSINGLPKSAIDITINGGNVQDNANRTWDGFYAFVQPRVDAVEEVTVVNSVAGAETSGDGSALIQFVTRRGTNTYRGGMFWQHRNTALNSNYWYNNRDLAPDPKSGKAPRNRMLLNQYGGRLGGPLPFPGFGEGGPFFHSGKDRAFFFVNYEEFRLPISFTRTRTVLTTDAQSGVYSYLAAIPQSGLPMGCTAVTSVQMQCRRDVFAIAAANSQLATADPMIAATLARIRNSVNSTGSLSAISNDPNRQLYNFMNSALDVRKFLTLRFDFNLTKRNSFELVIDRQKFDPTADYTRFRDPVFVGFPGYDYSAEPKSYSAALRSTLTRSVVNELRYTYSAGGQLIGTLSGSDFASTGGFNLNISTSGGAAGVSNPYAGNFGYSKISEPISELSDSVTWLTGTHMVSFGGEYKYLRDNSSVVNWVVPMISFAVDPSEGVAFSMFNTSALPGSTAAQQNDARSLYATLVGRMSFYDSAAVPDDNGVLQENGLLTTTLAQRAYGLYVQDQWRVRPRLSISFGIGWQPQEGFVVKTGSSSKLENPDEIWGVSGPGNIFKPGVLTGQAPRVVLYQTGEKAYKDDLNNFAPSVGIVWSPGGGGFSHRFLGSGSVIRAGFSRSFIREGSVQQTTPILNTPGGVNDASRSANIGNFVIGTNLRDPNNPNLAPQRFTGVDLFPITLNGGAAVTVDPEMRTGFVDSFSAGYQRQIGKDTVVEVRYVGTRGHRIRRTKNLNEINVIENGFADEFKKAQANLYANLAAGRGASFAYFGTGTGTSPLPIMLAYFNAAANYDPTNPARYAVANFTNPQLVNLLSVNAPNVIGFVSSGAFENNAVRRANAASNGLPVNFFRVNPSVNRANILSDDASTWYDAGVVELRRRLSSGLRIEANYVFSKALSNAFASSQNQASDYTLRPGGLDLARNVQVFDIRHAFKFNATYDLPAGRGKPLFSDAGQLTNAIVGGWSVVPVIRWQSGSPFSLGNVQLVGMTAKELQHEIRVRKGPNVVTYLPDDIILNTQRAFDISATSPTGYGTTFGGPPQGRFIAPPGYGNCVQRFTGECGFTNLILHGPSFFMFDASVAKKFRIDEKRDVEFRMTVFDVLNHPPFRVGGWDQDVIGIGVGGSTFGQLGPGSAYQDLQGTNNPGGRIVDIMFRFNF